MPSKHIILSNGRSGSNYIANLLNLHPQLTNYGEVLGDWTIPYQLHQKVSLGGNSVESYLDYIYESPLFFFMAQLYSVYSKIQKREKINFKTYQQIQSVGVKDFSINFIKRGIPNYFKDRPKIKIIHLYRNNILKRLISMKNMQSTGTISTKDPKAVKSKKIYLDPNTILEELAIFEKEKEEQFSLVDNLTNKEQRVLNICYEEFFSSEETRNNLTIKIFNLLDVKPIALESEQKKILSTNLPDLIDNYEEIEQILKGSPYEEYLS